MNETCLSFDFINDPGHGWLKVPFHYIQDFKIGSCISNFSYVNGDYIYLEEDCDANLFLMELNERGIEYAINDIYQENCLIRDFEYYRY